MTSPDWPPASAWPHYELLDFGDGQRLERFGQFIVARPAPVGADIVSSLWSTATATFEIGSDRRAQRGIWRPADALPSSWLIKCGPLRLELKPTDFGHLGIFPEQVGNWRWINDQVGRQFARKGRPPRVLNLFAYTGGSTLAAAAAGAELTHVDSSRSAVAWARRNADHSGLAAAPIRWIVDDAVRFVRREIARGNRYDAVILDPPSYGHGPAGEIWKLEDQLPTLLAECATLTASSRLFMLLSCHTPTVTPVAAARMLAESLGVSRDTIAAEKLAIRAADGRQLFCGVAARFCEPQ